MEKKISITIATWNRKDILFQVLSALVSQKKIPYEKYEIIVCDSHSSDGTAEIVGELIEKNSKIRIRHLHTLNILAAKRNLGITESEHEVVVFLDDDCVPEENFVYKYYNIFNAKNYISERNVFCGEVRFPYEWVTKSNYYRYRDAEHFYSKNNEQPLELDFKTIIVMNMAFEKKIFIKDIQKVDEDFIGYGCEDQELGWRLEKFLYKIYTCDSLIYHYEASSNINGYEKKIYHTARDGAKTLWSKAPDAAKAITSLKYVDPMYPHKNLFMSNYYKLIRFIFFGKYLAYLMSKFLNATDHVKLLYIPFIYKFVLASAYVQGAKDRCKKKANINDWYTS